MSGKNSASCGLNAKDVSVMWWCYASNTGAQTSICNTLNQQSFFGHILGRVLPGYHYRKPSLLTMKGFAS